jgi:hypothetical protein
MLLHMCMFVKQNDKAKYFPYTVKQENGTPIRRHSWAMEHLSSNMEHQQDQEHHQHQQHQVEWSRDKVQELCSKGDSQREISQTSSLC